MVRRLFQTDFPATRHEIVTGGSGAHVGPMKVRVSGKQVEIGETLPEHVRDRLGDAISKHFDGGCEAHVVFSREGSGYRSDCSAHLDSGVVLKAEGSGPDAYKAFDAALDHLEKQIRRYKRRLKNHHEKTAPRKGAGV